MQGGLAEERQTCSSASCSSSLEYAACELVSKARAFRVVRVSAQVSNDLHILAETDCPHLNHTGHGIAAFAVTALGPKAPATRPTAICNFEPKPPPTPIGTSKAPISGTNLMSQELTGCSQVTLRKTPGSGTRLPFSSSALKFSAEDGFYIACTWHMAGPASLSGAERLQMTRKTSCWRPANESKFPSPIRAIV